MSWNRVMAQNPRLGVGSGCQWTGSRSRSSRNAQSGTSSTKASWLDRSISSSRTLIEASSGATQVVWHRTTGTDNAGGRGQKNGR